MKKFLLLFVIITSLSSCFGISKFAYHAIDTNLSNSDYEYKVRNTVTGEASATYVLGIGGMSEDAEQLYESSFQNMMSRARLRDDQMIVNVIAESKFRCWLGLIMKQTVYTTGTIVEITPQALQNPNQQPVLQNSPQKPILQNPAEIPIFQPGTKYQVGDVISYNGIGAIVVMVKDDGTPLQLMTVEEAYVSWEDEFNKTLAFIGAIDSNCGINNTKIISRCNNLDVCYPAFAWCAKLGSNWYIPSKNEMEKIVALGVLGNINEPYLTSTEIDSANCYAILNGAIAMSKYTRAYVRAICYL